MSTINNSWKKKRIKQTKGGIACIKEKEKEKKI